MDRDRQTDDKDSRRPITEAWQKRSGAFWRRLTTQALLMTVGVGLVGAHIAAPSSAWSQQGITPQTASSPQAKETSQEEINKWIKDVMPPNAGIKHTETTSCRGGTQPQEFPIITVSIWYGTAIALED